MSLDGTGGGVPERERSRRIVENGGLEGGDATEKGDDSGVYMLLLLLFLVVLVVVCMGL